MRMIRTGAELRKHMARSVWLGTVAEKAGEGNGIKRCSERYDRCDDHLKSVASVPVMRNERERRK